MTAETASQVLPGKCRLVIQPNEVTPGESSEISKNLSSEELILRNDGTFDQTCHFASGETYRAERVAWRYDGGVHFERLKDCSGFLGLRGGITGASLVLRAGEPIRILLNPDLRVYYERKSANAT